MSIAREELELKKALTERMDKVDREFNENMEKMSKMIETVGNAIQQNCQMVNFLVNPQRQMNPFFSNFDTNR